MEELLTYPTSIETEWHRLEKVYDESEDLKRVCGAAHCLAI